MAWAEKVTEANLKALETEFRSAMTGAGSTPFLVEIPVTKQTREVAEELASRVPIFVLFTHCPTLATWAVLTPLSRNYGATSRDVYVHISRFLRDDFSDQASRDGLKSMYRQAARKIGLPVSGTLPTPLFFAPLGPPQSKHRKLARAFVGAALHSGPPAIEDTPSARAWQKRAVQSTFPNEDRLLATIEFDKSAHCARRFEAWRHEEAPINDTEKDLFAAYDAVAAGYGRSRRDITGPPQVFWDGKTLGLEFERSRHAQVFRCGLAPAQVAGGERRSLQAPWDSEITWSYQGVSRAIPFGIEPGTILVFDADTGTCLARVGTDVGSLQLAAERLVVLAREAVTAPSFGPAMPAADPSYKVAWVEAGDTLVFSGDQTIDLMMPAENALWVDATVLGRCGSKALMAGDGDLILKLDPDVGGRNRIARARLGGLVKYSEVEIDDAGQARIPFSLFEFGLGVDPGKVLFEILAPGAAGDLDARAEVAAATWIWPGLAAPCDALSELPRPGNFLEARSAGLRPDGDTLHVDLRAETQMLGLEIDGTPREIVLSVGAERLWHYRLATNDRILIPRGRTLPFAHENRGDRLIIASADRDADLIVCGQVQRRPFCVRGKVELDPDTLKGGTGDDDRIALRRSDGRVDVMVRLRYVDDPSNLLLEESDHQVSMSVRLPKNRDAVEVKIEHARGTSIAGAKELGHVPVPVGLPRGVSVMVTDADQVVRVVIDKSAVPGPARVLLATRQQGGHEFVPLKDAAGARLGFGLGGQIATPSAEALAHLAHFLAEPVPDALEDQFQETIGTAYERTFRALGERRMVGSVRAALGVTRQDGEPPRHDIAGVAPWVYEAQPHAFRHLKEGSGFAALARIGDVPAVSNLPDPDGTTPLATWLKRVDADHLVPNELGPSALQHGFRLMRHLLRETDLRDLVGGGRIGVSTRLVCAAWSDDISALRAFDIGGGGDEAPARIVAAIERFARAAAMGRADSHVDDLVFRTGLSRHEIGRSLTLMLRAGIEFFVYFRALWSQAAAQKKDRQ